METVEIRASQNEIDTLMSSLTNHPFPQDDNGKRMIEEIEDMRDRAKLLGQTILNYCPASRERSLAITKLEESVMWAVKSIVLPR